MQDDYTQVYIHHGNTDHPANECWKCDDCLQIRAEFEKVSEELPSYTILTPEEFLQVLDDLNHPPEGTPKLKKLLEDMTPS